MSDEIKSDGKSARPHPVIDADECKSCGRCVAACPKKCLKISDRLNRRGVKPAEYVGEGCTGCAACFYNCPEPYAISVEKP
jgi:NAD-dependent dihydropyrimidine dehydrogenase PreA subunit